MIKKVISGGQTGADCGGLRAAKLMGIETGGMAPAGYKTLNGSNYELRDEFGLEEHVSDSYVPRTEYNARRSDGTLRFAADFRSAGEKCTLKAILRYKKPYLDIDINHPIEPARVVEWIKRNKIEILNIAGNSEKNAKGIEKFVADYLLQVFALIRRDKPIGDGTNLES